MCAEHNYSHAVSRGTFCILVTVRTSAVNVMASTECYYFIALWHVPSALAMHVFSLDDWTVCTLCDIFIWSVNSIFIHF